MGLLLCLAALLTVLPAMIVWYDRRSEQRAAAGRTVRHDWLATALPHWSPARARGWAVAAVVMFVALAPGAHYVRFEDNLLELQPPGLPCVEWQNRMLADSSAAGLFAAVRCDSLNEVDRVVHAAAQCDQVGMTESIMDMIVLGDAQRDATRSRLHRYEDVHIEPRESTEPISADQLRRAARSVDRLIRYANDGGDDRSDVALSTETLMRLSQTLRAMARTLDEGPRDVAQALTLEMGARLAQVAAATATIVAADTLPLEDVLPVGLSDAYQSADGQYLVRIYPRRSAWDMRQLDAFINQVRTIAPDISGSAVIQLENLHDLRDGFGDASLMAAVVVIVLVWLDFRRLGDTVLAVLPLSVGLMGTIGAMGWLGWGFNVTNFIAVPILIGLGVDQGIHIVHRCRDASPSGVDLKSTRSAVILTAVTTMIGFGSLLTAEHIGAKSLGQVMVVGTASCLVASLVVLPPLIRWTRALR
jgi:hypothetical protein